MSLWQPLEAPLQPLPASLTVTTRVLTVRLAYKFCILLNPLLIHLCCALAAVAALAADATAAVAIAGAVGGPSDATQAVVSPGGVGVSHCSAEHHPTHRMNAVATSCCLCTIRGGHWRAAGAAWA